VELVDGTDDTFEFFWDLAGIDDTEPLPPGESSELEAVLFSEGASCSTDTENVVINNNNDTQPAQAETVEIVNPENGEELGFYRQESGVARGVFNVKASALTTNIQAKYAISAPGTEPAWKSCGTAELYDATAGATAAGDTVRCTLATGDQPEAVTAVAAIANDSPQTGYNASFDDSSDAHRVASYAQVPSGLTLGFEDAAGAPTNGNSVEPDACSPFLAARVIDQDGAPISGANVDVHAQGPTDSLKFVQVTNSTFQPPDKGGHGPTEPASNCAGDDTGTQGEHNVADVDTKHIESAAAGTNDLGRFVFRMFHRAQGAAGEDTQITAWADRDFNDVFCQEEPNANAAIGWGAGTSASATGLPPAEGTCPFGETASPTSTSSPSPTGSPTETSSPTPTPTESPTPEPTTRVATNLSLKYDKPAFKGAASSSQKRCETRRVIQLKKKKPGKDVTVGTARTNNKGKYNIKKRKAKGTYYTVAPAKRFTKRDGSVVVCRKGRSPNRRAGR
jgi:hypothetical protein